MAIGRSPLGLNGRVPRLTVTPITAAAASLLFGFVALFCSDVLAVIVLESSAWTTRVQVLIGVVEVLLTAGLVLVLTRQSRRPLERALAQRDEHLQELSVLHRVFRHNFRNDLNLVQGYGSILADDRDDSETAEKFEVAVDSLAQLVDDVVFISDIPSSGDARTEFDVVRTLQQIIEDVRAAHEIDISLSSPSSVTVSASPKLDRAFHEVLSNAAEHHHESPSVSVTVDCDGWVEIRVADDGPGIPESIRRQLGRRTTRSIDHLDGLGLWIAYWITVRSGGAFAIEANDPRGSVVVFRLPPAEHVTAASPRHA